MDPWENYGCAGSKYNPHYGGTKSNDSTRKVKIDHQNNLRSLCIAIDMNKVKTDKLEDYITNTVIPLIEDTALPSCNLKREDKVMNIKGHPSYMCLIPEPELNREKLKQILSEVLTKTTGINKTYISVRGLVY